MGEAWSQKAGAIQFATSNPDKAIYVATDLLLLVKTKKIVWLK